MEIYREQSLKSPERQMYKYLALVPIIALMGWAATQTAEGKSSILAWTYSLVFLSLWIWRFMFSYTYILTDQEFIVLSHGLGFTRKYAAKLADTESYTNKYDKAFFKRTKLRHYVHRYASDDSNKMRLIVFNQKGSLRGVLFKSSDKMINELRQLMPDRFLPLE